MKLNLGRTYIASRFQNIEIVRSLETALHERGVNVVSTWTQEHPDQSLTDHGRRSAAERDLSDLDNAQTVIVYTVDCDRVPGGMHFEAGYAYAKGLKLVVVGPRVNIFYDLSNMTHFDTIQELLESLL